MLNVLGPNVVTVRANPYSSIGLLFTYMNDRPRDLIGKDKENLPPLLSMSGRATLSGMKQVAKGPIGWSCGFPTKRKV